MSDRPTLRGASQKQKRSGAPPPEGPPQVLPPEGPRQVPPSPEVLPLGMLPLLYVRKKQGGEVNIYRCGPDQEEYGKYHEISTEAVQKAQREPVKIYWCGQNLEEYEEYHEISTEAVQLVLNYADEKPVRMHRDQFTELCKVDQDTLIKSSDGGPPQYLEAEKSKLKPRFRLVEHNKNNAFGVKDNASDRYFGSHTFLLKPEGTNNTIPNAYKNLNLSGIAKEVDCLDGAIELVNAKGVNGVIGYYHNADRFQRCPVYGAGKNRTPSNRTYYRRQNPTQFEGAWPVTQTQNVYKEEQGEIIKIEDSIITQPRLPPTVFRSLTLEQNTQEVVIEDNCIILSDQFVVFIANNGRNQVKCTYTFTSRTTAFVGKEVKLFVVIGGDNPGRFEDHDKPSGGITRGQRFMPNGTIRVSSDETLPNVTFYAVNGMDLGRYLFSKANRMGTLDRKSQSPHCMIDEQGNKLNDEQGQKMVNTEFYHSKMWALKFPFNTVRINGFIR